LELLTFNKEKRTCILGEGVVIWGGT